MRRCRVCWARPPPILIGSFQANSGTQACSSARSTDRLSNMRRASRAVLSQMIASNPVPDRQLGSRPRTTATARLAVQHRIHHARPPLSDHPARLPHDPVPQPPHRRMPRRNRAITHTSDNPSSSSVTGDHQLCRAPRYVLVAFLASPSARGRRYERSASGALSEATASRPSSASHAEIVACRSDVGCCHPRRIRFRYAPGVRPRWRRKARLKECAEA